VIFPLHFSINMETFMESTKAARSLLSIFGSMVLESVSALNVEHYPKQ
jgi:hypothetical protein